MRDMLTLEQAADTLNVSKKFLLIMVDENKILPVSLEPLLFDESHVNEVSSKIQIEREAWFEKLIRFSEDCGAYSDEELDEISQYQKEQLRASRESREQLIESTNKIIAEMDKVMLGLGKE